MFNKAGTLGGRCLLLTSRLNKTPPMGEPKATDMPEAAAAEKTSLFRATYTQDVRTQPRMRIRPSYQDKPHTLTLVLVDNGE